jgi:hypothetical protein
MVDPPIAPSEPDDSKLSVGLADFNQSVGNPGGDARRFW